MIHVLGTEGDRKESQMFSLTSRLSREAGRRLMNQPSAPRGAKEKSAGWTGSTGRNEQGPRNGRVQVGAERVRV